MPIPVRPAVGLALVAGFALGWVAHRTPAASPQPTAGSEMVMTSPSPVTAPPPRTPPAETISRDAIPAIPAALRGCWRLDDSEYPGQHETLNVAANEIVRDGTHGYPDFLRIVSPTEVDGRFSFDDHGHDATLATGLVAGGGNRGADPGQLVLVEGDAGSYTYSRCR